MVELIFTTKKGRTFCVIYSYCFIRLSGEGIFKGFDYFNSSYTDIFLWVFRYCVFVRGAFFFLNSFRCSCHPFLAESLSFIMFTYPLFSACIAK